MDITEESDGLLSLHKLPGYFHPEESFKFLARLHVHLLDIIAFAKLERNYVLMSKSIFFSNSFNSSRISISGVIALI